MATALTEPLVFEPLFMERVWGGRALQEIYGKNLPTGAPIGESWDIVDRVEAQSVVAKGSLRGQTLHSLWEHHRPEIFGGVPDAPRFPLLAKILDARETLSLQVHPPPHVAIELGGEPKTEFWYIVHASPAAELYVGLRSDSSRERFETAVKNGEAAEHVHRIAVKAGDAMFLPSGRLHAIGAGNVIVEIQQNSDTTYRVFDWNRLGDNGKQRQLHVEESLRCIDFEDREPEIIRTNDESLVRASHFEIEKWNLSSRRSAATRGQFAIVFCLAGKICCGKFTAQPGEFFLIPSSLEVRELIPLEDSAELLRITIP